MEPRKENFMQEIVKFSLIALLVVLPIRLFIAQPFIVNGASMEPTFDTGDYVIVDQISYHLEAPKRGDVIIFKHPSNPSLFLIKRIIGLPGETIEITGKEVLITNTATGASHLLDESFLEPENLSNDYVPPTKLGVGEYFVMGDNRRQSSDSRSWGFLPEKNIVGRALIRLYPLTEIGIFPGFHNESSNTP